MRIGNGLRHDEIRYPAAGRRIRHRERGAPRILLEEDDDVGRCCMEQLPGCLLAAGQIEGPQHSPHRPVLIVPRMLARRRISRLLVGPQRKRSAAVGGTAIHRRISRQPLAESFGSRAIPLGLAVEQNLFRGAHSTGWRALAGDNRGAAIALRRFGQRGLLVSAASTRRSATSGMRTDAAQPSRCCVGFGLPKLTEISVGRRYWSSDVT